jgi:hypothetical protein
LCALPHFAEHNDGFSDPDGRYLVRRIYRAGAIRTQCRRAQSRGPTHQSCGSSGHVAIELPDPHELIHGHD